MEVSSHLAPLRGLTFTYLPLACHSAVNLFSLSFQQLSQPVHIDVTHGYAKCSQRLSPGPRVREAKSRSSLIWIPLRLSPETLLSPKHPLVQGEGPCQGTFISVTVHSPSMSKQQMGEHCFLLLSCPG